MFVVFNFRGASKACNLFNRLKHYFTYISRTNECIANDLLLSILSVKLLSQKTL